MKGPEPRRDGIDDLLVQSPNRIPLERNDCLRRSLRQHELCQSFDGHSTTADAWKIYIEGNVVVQVPVKRTSNGGETRVIPPANETLINKPVELTLGQKSVDEVQATEVPDIDFAKPGSLEHPLILGVPIAIFVSPEGVRDTFDRVDNRAGKVICGIDLPLVTVPAMRNGPQGFNGTHTPCDGEGEYCTYR